MAFALHFRYFTLPSFLFFFLSSDTSKSLFHLFLASIYFSLSFSLSLPHLYFFSKFFILSALFYSCFIFRKENGYKKNYKSDSWTLCN